MNINNPKLISTNSNSCTKYLPIILHWLITELITVLTNYSSTNYKVIHNKGILNKYTKLISLNINSADNIN